MSPIRYIVSPHSPKYLLLLAGDLGCHLIHRPWVDSTPPQTASRSSLLIFFWKYTVVTNGKTDRQTDRQTEQSRNLSSTNRPLTLYLTGRHGLKIWIVYMPSVLWCCWMSSRKGIRPVENWVVGCWLGYVSGMRCRFAYGPADATATHYLLLQ